MKKFLLLLAFATVFTGCSIVDNLLSDEGDEEGVDNMPWNTPAGWEDEVIGLPY